MEQKIKGGATSKVVVASEDGQVEEYISKAPIEKAIAVSNEKNWHTTEGGSQLHDQEFVDKLGAYGKGPEIDHILDGSFNFLLVAPRLLKIFCRHVPQQ